MASYASEFRGDKIVVKSSIMSDENAVLKAANHVARDFDKYWSVQDMSCSYSMYSCRANVALWIDKGYKFVTDVSIIYLNDGYFDYPIICFGEKTSSLYINDSESVCTRSLEILRTSQHLAEHLQPPRDSAQL
jgi:hypothetical protein